METLAVNPGLRRAAGGAGRSPRCFPLLFSLKRRRPLGLTAVSQCALGRVGVQAPASVCLSFIKGPESQFAVRWRTAEVQGLSTNQLSANISPVRSPPCALASRLSSQWKEELMEVGP